MVAEDRCTISPVNIHYILVFVSESVQDCTNDIGYMLLQSEDVAQWVACMTLKSVSRGVEPHQKIWLFPLARNFTLIDKYWLVPGTYASVIAQRNQNKTEMHMYVK